MMKWIAGLFAALFFCGTVLAESWSVTFSVCDRGSYLFVVNYSHGEGSRWFDWQSGDDSGQVRLWPDRAPYKASIYTGSPDITVSLGNQTKHAHTDADCMGSAQGAESHVYLVALLDGGPATWACEGYPIVDAQGEPIITPRQTMAWEPAGGELLPYTVLILSHYIDPGECVAYQDGVTLAGAYADFERFTCLAYQHEDRNCPGILTVRD